MLGTYHLTALFDILNRIHFLYEPEKLWQLVLENACKTLQSDAGAFYEIADDEQALNVKAAYGVEVKHLAKAPFKVGTGVCGWVAQFQQPTIVNDVRQDNRFNRAIDHQTGFLTKSILCIPVFSTKKNYGVLEVLNKKAGQFTAQDQEFMTLLSRQAAIAYQNLLLMAEISHKQVLLDSLLQNLSGGLIAIDQASCITILNPASRQLLKLNVNGGGLGKSSVEILKDYPWMVETIQKTLQTQSTVSRQETQLLVGGETQKFGYTTILIADHDKKVLGAGIIFQKLASNPT